MEFASFPIPAPTPAAKPAAPQADAVTAFRAAVSASGLSMETANRRIHRGVLYASGLIAGESLTGVGIAFLASLGIARLDLGLPDVWMTLLTVFGAGAILVSFHLFSRTRGDESLTPDP